jgi:hypothetical protein
MVSYEATFERVNTERSAEQGAKQRVLDDALKSNPEYVPELSAVLVFASPRWATGDRSQKANQDSFQWRRPVAKSKYLFQGPPK